MGLLTNRVFIWRRILIAAVAMDFRRNCRLGGVHVQKSMHLRKREKRHTSSTQTAHKSTLMPQIPHKHRFLVCALTQ
ncbi:MAG: hypothetical protein AMXMBFR84_31450 [Candidatus Hydrogenedentota bacterium]